MNLILRVEPAVPITLPYALVLALLALVPGFSLLYLVGSISYAVSHGERLGDTPTLRSFLIAGMVWTIPLVLWILARRPFVRLARPARWGVIGVALIVAGAGILRGIARL